MEMDMEGCHNKNLKYVVLAVGPASVWKLWGAEEAVLGAGRAGELENGQWNNQ